MAAGYAQHHREEHAGEEAWNGQRRQRRVEDLEKVGPRKPGQEDAGDADDQTPQRPANRPGDAHSDCTADAPEPCRHEYPPLLYIIKYMPSPESALSTSPGALTEVMRDWGTIARGSVTDVTVTDRIQTQVSNL